MLKKQLLFLTIFSFFSCFGQDSTYVSAFLKDEYKVFELENNLDQDLSDFYLTIPYIQNADGVISKNENYDFLTDSIETLESGGYYLEEKDIINHVHDQFLFSDNIPPVLGNVTDGKYIQYFAPLAYVDEDTIKFIRNKISSIFYIKNNKTDGTAYWFLFDQQEIYKTGNYKEGIREGKWRMQIRSVKNESKNQRSIYILPRIKYISTNVLFTIEAHYVNGIKEGCQIKTNTIFYKTPFVQKEEIHFVNNLEEDKYLYSENDIPIVTGFYKNGKHVGDWYYYDWFNAKNNLSINQYIELKNHKKERPFLVNSYSKINNKPKDYKISNRVLIEHHKINENNLKGKSTLIRGNSANIRDDHNQYSYNHYDNGLSEEYIFVATMDYDNIITIETNENFTIIDTRLLRQELIDSLGYIFDYLEYEHYYQNGQLFTKFKLENGNLISEDTIFWKNGKVKELIEYDTAKKQYLQKEFEKNGDLKNTKTYDEHGKVIDKEKNKVKQIIIDGNAYLLQIDQNKMTNLYKFENKDSIPLVGKDSTILISDQFLYSTLTSEKEGEKSIEFVNKTTYNPGTKTVVISEIKKEIDGIITTTLIYDSLFLTCKKTETIVIGELMFSHEIIEPLTDYGKKVANTIKQTQKYSKELCYLGNIQGTDAERKAYYEEKLFTGTLEIIFSDKIKVPKLKKNVLTIYLKNSNSILTFFGNSYPVLASYAKPLNLWKGVNSETPIKNKNLRKTFIGEFENGKLHGICKFINRDQKIMTQIPFSNNYRNGTVNIYSEVTNPISKSENYQYYLSSIENYIQGAKNGVFLEFDQSGDTLNYSYYLNGLMNGLSFTKKTSKNNIKINKTYSQNGLSTGKTQVFDTLGILLEEMNYKNKKLHGLSSFYDNKGILYQSTYFNNGVLNDTVITYNSDKSIDTKWVYQKNVFLKELNYENGILTKEFINDTLNIKIIMPREDRFLDSRLSEEFYRQNYIFSSRTPFLLTGYLKNYNAEGTITSEGFVEGEDNTSNLTKIKLWKYNYPIPNGKYTINYVDSIIEINDSTQFETIGEFLQKDENENLISRKYIVEEEILYNCGENETYDILLYYIDYEKDTSLHLKNGFVKNYYTNGVKQSEGNNINGLPNGLWKFYNDNGSLREMGHYINGKKNGRWLGGDLSKVHYMGDLCLEIDSKKMELYVENLESKLFIQETFFMYGKEISTSGFVLSK